MTPELRAILEGWLESDDPETRRAAAVRLAMGERPAPPPMPTPFTLPAAFRLGWKNCLYASHSQTGCCGGALTCHRLGEVIPLARCVQCLEVDTR